ncbi:TetR family transcriptional regulator [Fontibacillus phaseoli]|uniref:TetR family transcriptional regulator n=1 Tax=Fontibacillus phaseoli TaxID=1416533 RepID=A0A369AYP4_9BACL|nr:TetR family transcriptional regulator [Fontibacillus phaseoli]
METNETLTDRQKSTSMRKSKNKQKSMGKQKSTSKDKLMQAALSLMAEKGYNGVSTKEIAAEAGVSEMTLFRNFGGKLNLLDAAIDRFYYTGAMETIFAERLTWNLRSDLRLIAETYHEIMNRNRMWIRVVLQEAELSAVRENAQKHPSQLRELLTDYFSAMADKGKLIPTSPEAQAITFMWMNYGAFMTHLYGSEGITRVALTEFLDCSVELFARGLTP